MLLLGVYGLVNCSELMHLITLFKGISLLLGLAVLTCHNKDSQSSRLCSHSTITIGASMFVNSIVVLQDLSTLDVYIL